MIEIEDVLIANLADDDDVDGHDAGSGEVNIFIRTNAPKEAFDRIRAMLGSRDFWADARVAYREVAKNDYTILWPKGLNEFKVA